MRLLTDENRILISVSELVSIARRRISATLPLDENEPSHFTPSQRAALGLGASEPRAVSLNLENDGVQFRLTGTIDQADGDKITIFRVSNAATDAQRKAEAAQWRAEGFVLGKILADSSGLEEIVLCVVIVDSASKERTESVETVKRGALGSFFDKCLRAVAVYARPEIERVRIRVPSMKRVKFPYDDARDGQVEFIKHAYRVLSRGGSLFASAPTGTGKTVSVIYPVIKALGNGKCEKAFYLTPKSTTAEAARDCLELLSERGAIIRAIIISSKEKSCPMRLVCREDSRLCELAKCNRLAEAVMDVYSLKKTVIELPDIREISTRHAVCPYELELAYSELCDVVICDVNYLFDPSVYMRRFFTQGGDYAFLIDEAHNLPDRAREMYSAELSLSELDEILNSAVIGALSPIRKRLPELKARLYSILRPYVEGEMRRGENGESVGATHLSSIPYELYGAVSELVQLLQDEEMSTLKCRDDERGARLKEVRALLYKIKKLESTLDFFDTGYRLFIFARGEELTLRLYCIDTGNRIQERINRGRGAIFFSATLSPIEYYRAMLSSDRHAEALEVDSPFDSSQLSVSIIDKISTRYSERARTLPAVSRTIAATLSAKRGHYIVFAPSFEYAEALHREFSERYPKVRSMLQRKDMSVAEKTDFLAEFSKNPAEYLVGFCVMGGIYSEGIDLTGDTLIGAIVVSIGMPTISYEREAMADYFEEKYESGKQFAYIYPGMNKVFQAAGRVIRREDDRGVIVLIDDRFADPIYKKSIPSLWRGMQYVSDAKALREQLDIFWNNKEDV